MYVIINGVSSDTIQGLQVLSLPPITKPKMRRQVDTIDGRAGDIITELGYEAYDRTITVLLHHNYDLDAITAFFNTSGEIIFSNEPDKKYYFRLLEKIDYERAVQFKTANITFHVQPYKYPVNETPLTVSTTAWEGTDYDQTPYIYRAVADSSVEVGNREVIEQITGGTVAWNQLVHNGNFADTTYWSKASTATFSVSNNIGTFKAAARYHNLIAQDLPNMVSGHVYMGIIDAQSYTNSNTILCVRRDSGSSVAQRATATLSTAMGQKAVMLKASDAGTTRFFVQDDNETGWGEIKIKNAMLIDLTQLFGSTIADYIYQQEQSQSGKGVSLFKSLFPKAYYAYNSGGLLSVKTSARETTGKNLFAPYTRSDSSASGVTWSYQGGSFTARGTATGTSYASLIGNNWQTVEGSIFGNLLGKQITISGGKDGIYINLAFRQNSSDSGYQTNWVTNGTITVPTDGTYQVYFNARVTSGWSGEATIQPQVELGSTATDYAPYEKHTYPLSNIELRGIPKLVNNKLTYDGDIYKAGGSVTRRYGIRAYQSGDATGETMITDGTNTVYKLSSPTTETTTPYTETQICSPYGTESFVDDRDVQIPVGHKTRYKQINDPADITVPNAGNVPSAPTIQLTGSGTVGVYLGNAQTLQVNIPEDGITIDTEAQDATSNGKLANRSVTGDYDSVRLQPGDNDVSFSGDVSAVITKYTRWV